MRKDMASDGLQGTASDERHRRAGVSYNEVRFHTYPGVEYLAHTALGS